MKQTLLLLLLVLVVEAMAVAKFCNGSLFKRDTVSGGISWSNANASAITQWSLLSGTEDCTGAFAADGNVLVCLNEDGTQLFTFTLNDAVSEGSVPMKANYSISIASSATIGPITTIMYWNNVSMNSTFRSDFFCLTSPPYIFCGTYDSGNLSLITSPDYSDVASASYIREQPKIFVSRRPSVCPFCSQILTTTFFTPTRSGFAAKTPVAVGISTQPFEIMGTYGSYLFSLLTSSGDYYTHDLLLRPIKASSTTVRLAETVPSQQTCTGLIYRTIDDPSLESSSSNQLIQSSIRQTVGTRTTNWYSGTMSGFAWTPSTYSWRAQVSPPAFEPIPDPIIEPILDEPAEESPVSMPTNAIDCEGSAPADCFKCVDGLWVSNRSVNAPTIIFDGKSEINGSLTITEELLLIGLSSTISVSECYSLEGGIVLELTLDEYALLATKNISQIELIQGRPCTQLSTSSDLKISIKGSNKSCKKVIIKAAESAERVVAVFRVSSAKCDLWWISLVSVFGFVIMLAVAIALICTCSKRCRQKIRPFSQ